MMQSTGIAASNQLTFSCSVEGVATMETAGVRRDSWRAHVQIQILQVPCQQGFFFFSHGQKNNPQLIQKREPLLYRSAVQC
jgi:hypothetical protein